MLDRVTITGADDSIGRPENLLDLSMEFPFVEWGILVAASHVGEPRFPSLAWLHEFRQVANEHKLATSLHLCGRFVRLILFGELDSLVTKLATGYERIQLNFHAERDPCEPERALKVLDKLKQAGPGGKRQFIFQLDGERGNEHLEAIAIEETNAYGECNCVGLFDVSGGAGVLPKDWPAPMYHENGEYDYHGYAGGLGPDNLAKQIPMIEKASKGCRYWIDMETRVRSEDDRQFDLAKVRRCLELAAPFVGKPRPH